MVCYLPRPKSLTVLVLPLGHALGWGYGPVFKFTYTFTLTFTSAFLLEVITWISFMLGSGN